MKISQFLARIFLGICLEIVSTYSTEAQYFFDVHIESCKPKSMTLANYDVQPRIFLQRFDSIIDHLSTQFNFSGKKGQFYFQVLIDQNSKCCVLSHSDVLEGRLSKAIIAELEAHTDWIPFFSEGVRVEYTVALDFTIANNKLNIEVVETLIEPDNKVTDELRFGQVVFNEKYSYTNPNFSSYKFKRWVTDDQGFMDGRVKEIASDSSGGVWLISQRDSYYFKDGIVFQNEDLLPPSFCEIPLKHVTADFAGNVWLSNAEVVMSIRNDKSVRVEKNLKPGVVCTGLSFQYSTGEWFVFTTEGLWINNEQSWNLLSKETTPSFISDKVNFAHRDSKRRLWVSTGEGSFLVDEFNKILNIRDLEFLRTCKINSIAEDQSGNVYFSWQKLNSSDTELAEIEGGLGVFNSKGRLVLYNSSNSGLPQNLIQDLHFDKQENVLWMACRKSGLVRYDLDKSWEMYNIAKSELPLWMLNSIAANPDGGIYIGGNGHLIYFGKNELIH